jgi:hypothetical protein
MPSQLSQLLDRINARHGTTYRLLRRYAGGESGAYAVSDVSGDRFALKWDPDPASVDRFRSADTATRALARKGYPVPAYVLVGSDPAGSYGLQTELPGTPLGTVRAEHLPELLRLVELQAGMAAAAGLPDAGWPAPVADPVLYGGPGFCLLETMRSYSAATAELLAEAQHLVRVAQHESFTTTDIVHYDFNPANVLMDAGQISGVIDWEASCAGDRAFDLVTQLFYGHADIAVRDALWSRVLALASPRVAAAYVAHLAHRQVEWCTRHYPAATVDHWLDWSRRILADVHARL